MESCSSRGYFWTSVSSLLLLLLNACSIHTLSIPAILLLLLVETSNSVKAKDKFTIKMNLGTPFPLWSLSWSERDDSCGSAPLQTCCNHCTNIPWHTAASIDLKEETNYRPKSKMIPRPLLTNKYIFIGKKKIKNRPSFQGILPYKWSQKTDCKCVHT